MRKQPASDSSNEQKRGSSSPSVAFYILDSKQVLVREQVTVDARQDHASQGIVLESTAGDSLGAALEGHQGQRNQNSPVYCIAACGRGSKRHDRRRRHRQQCLGQKGRTNDPSAFGRKVAMKARKDKGAHTEGQ